MGIIEKEKSKKYVNGTSNPFVKNAIIKEKLKRVRKVWNAFKPEEQDRYRIKPAIKMIHYDNEPIYLDSLNFRRKKRGDKRNVIITNKGYQELVKFLAVFDVRFVQEKKKNC